MGFSAVIIAGGKSSRIAGQNKALLRIGGLTIIEREVLVLKHIFDEIIIVANRPEDFKAAGLAQALCEDAVESRGPISGVYTGLLKMQSEAGFFCACDMPFLNGELIKILLDQSPEFDLICPRIGGKYVEPLHAVYRKTCMGPIKHLLKNPGPPKLRDIFPMVKTFFLDVENVCCKKQYYDFFNVNTREDYIEAMSIDEKLI
ncbi:MAG: molybdenum cofactor guanylyltransferase [Tepidanaerobacteraceae bacterium]|nr:molybdenum cofactor guanylyltransferase [Tepidanaerobacteraceae bacterium]